MCFLPVGVDMHDHIIFSLGLSLGLGISAAGFFGSGGSRHLCLFAWVGAVGTEWWCMEWFFKNGRVSTESTALYSMQYCTE